MSLLLLFIRPKMSERERERRGRVEPFVLSTDEYLHINFVYIFFYFLLYDVNDEDFSRKVFFISSTLGSENARFRQLINIL